MSRIFSMMAFCVFLASCAPVTPELSQKDQQSRASRVHDSLKGNVSSLHRAIDIVVSACQLREQGAWTDLRMKGTITVATNLVNVSQLTLSVTREAFVDSFSWRDVAVADKIDEQRREIAAGVELLKHDPDGFCANPPPPFSQSGGSLDIGSAELE